MQKAMRFKNVLSALLTLFAFSSTTMASESSWYLEQTPYDVKTLLVDDVSLRTGYYRESSEVPFKGCVIYLQGLADSGLNQAPLFQYLSQHGYRSVFFDFMGQGGSSGTMNNTRIFDPMNPTLQLSTQAQLVWEKYATLKDSVNGRDCSQSKKLVMGWSTGGLPAYMLAHEQWADAVVLFAPGIHVRAFVGESAAEPKKLLTFQQVITERTLTRNKFEGMTNPHVDPIKPLSPAHIPMFATNLLMSSKISQNWKISPKVPGLTFITGENDFYVNAPAVEKTLQQNAPHFKLERYPESYHELTNEMPEVSQEVYQKTVLFLNEVLANK
ncbi:alpha/beta hydrolase [Bdellovibrio sp. HCB337]|uniref:alpha/beta hydrolase n=1 Tax=Bdellovibrio sp. HCB337 TaxID=3394358 RepID=UPI0039A4289F